MELNEFQVCVHEGYHAFYLAVYNITTLIIFCFVSSDAEILILTALQVRLVLLYSLLKFLESRVAVMIAAHTYLSAVCSCLAMCAGDDCFAESFQGANNFSWS